MSGTLIQTIQERGAWDDLETSNGFPWTGTGQRWLPPSDLIAVDCSQIYRACLLTSDGAEVTYAPQSYARQLLSDFDDGPQRFNPPAIVPFESTWLEWGSHGRSPHKVGTLVTNGEEGAITTWTFMSFPHIRDPFFVTSCSLGPDCNAVGCRPYIYDALRRWASMLSDRAIKEWGEISGGSLGIHFMMDHKLFTAIRLALKLPNSRLAQLADTQPRKIGKKQKRLRPSQKTKWREVVMVGFTPTLNRRSASRGGQRFMAEHAVRANRALYTEAAPLFGNPKLVGWFIRPPHKRGSPKNGTVIQARRIELP